MPTNERGYEVPTLAADTVLVHEDRVLLIERGREPYEGQWALPGGFVEVGETVEHAALRELREETSLEGEIDALVGVYSDPERDPRGHVVTVTFLASPVGELEAVAGDDAADAAWFDLDDPPAMAFDHEQALADARPLGP